MVVQPYLFFNGRCEEAVEFYSKAIGAKVEMLMRMKEAPESPPGGLPPGTENKVMHVALRIGDTIVMGSDGMVQGNPEFKGFSLSLQVKTAADADRLFNALAAGGKVTMPLEKTFFSPRFGMVVDKFGMHWMINLAS